MSGLGRTFSSTPVPQLRVPQHSDVKHHYVSLLTVGSAEKLIKIKMFNFSKFFSVF
jgi:hypothetical protein